MIKEKIIIEGGNKLSGKVKISGSKNAALPILAATILSSAKVTLNNLPHLTDISMMLNLLLSLGAKVSANGHGGENNSRARSFDIYPEFINSTEADYNIVSKMRASIVVLGPIVARFHKAKVALPGGCAIGARPVDLHLMALEKLGTKFQMDGGYIIATAPKGLVGNEITFPVISVGATENALMAASLAKGKTIINNAAIEPEIIDLMNFLNSMGANITVQDRQFTVIGQTSLKSSNYNISADRIEAGSYAVAALATKGNIELSNVTKDILDPIKPELVACGAKIDSREDSIKVSYQNLDKKDVLHIETGPYPEFPTDMQAQFAALSAMQEFSSTIQETIFENRFMHIPELNRMGANITISDNKLLVKGNSKFSAAEVTASDLRASMALIIAALSTKGETIINNVYHLDRGYEAIEEKLFKCGAIIYRKYA